MDGGIPTGKEMFWLGTNGAAMRPLPKGPANVLTVYTEVSESDFTSSSGIAVGTALVGRHVRFPWQGHETGDSGMASGG